MRKITEQEQEFKQEESTLASSYAQYTRERIIEIAVSFGFALDEGRNKSACAAQLSELILANPEAVLEHLTSFELELFRNVMDSRKNCGVLSIEMPEQIPAIAARLIAPQPVAGKRGHVHYVTFDEVTTVYRPLVDEIIEQRETKGFPEMGTMALGLLNIYGCIETEEFIDMIYEKMRRRYRKKTIASYLQTVNLFFESSFVMDYQDQDVEFYSSPFLSKEDISFVMNSIDTAYEVPRKESFTPEEIVPYGNLPYPTFTVPKTFEMEELLHDKLDCSRKQTQYTLALLWQQMQIQTEGDEMQRLAKLIMRVFKEDNEPLFNLVYDWLFSLPLWMLKGNARNETHPNALCKLERRDL